MRRASPSRKRRTGRAAAAGGDKDALKVGPRTGSASRHAQASLRHRCSGSSQKSAPLLSESTALGRPLLAPRTECAGHRALSHHDRPPKPPEDARTQTLPRQSPRPGGRSSCQAGLNDLSRWGPRLGERGHGRGHSVGGGAVGPGPRARRGDTSLPSGQPCVHPLSRPEGCRWTAGPWGGHAGHSTAWRMRKKGPFTADLSFPTCKPSTFCFEIKFQGLHTWLCLEKHRALAEPCVPRSEPGARARRPCLVSRAGQPRQLAPEARLPRLPELQVQRSRAEPGRAGCGGCLEGAEDTVGGERQTPV